MGADVEKNRLNEHPSRSAKNDNPQISRPCGYSEALVAAHARSLSRTVQERNASDVINNTIALFLRYPRIFLNCNLELPIFIFHISRGLKGLFTTCTHESPPIAPMCLRTARKANARKQKKFFKDSALADLGGCSFWRNFGVARLRGSSWTAPFADIR